VANGQVNTDQVLRIGQNALYFEDYVLSIQYFNQVIEAKPYMSQAYLYRAIAKLNLDDYAGAEADAGKALDLNPFLTDAWEVRGVARQNMGKFTDAVRDYNEALGLLPRNRQIMFNKAMAEAEAKDYESADSTYDELLRYYPGYDNGYLGRAKLRLARTDTVGAVADIDQALKINRNAVNGYILRAAIRMGSNGDKAAALADMDHAVKLEPGIAGLYINRAYLRYSLDDYFGAMADYDYAIELEPMNAAALFNRGLLLMEVNDNDRALSDFTRILLLNPDDYRALYNRAVIYGEKHDYDAALADIDRVIDRFPDFSGAYLMRSEFLRSKGEMRGAKRDYDKALALTRMPAAAAADDTGDRASGTAGETDTPRDSVPQELMARRFSTLVTIDNETRLDEEYNNTAIRGKVQNRDWAIDIEPLMELAYYSSPTELRRNTYYLREVDDLNATRLLKFAIVVTSRPPQLTDPEVIERHFSSIEYYNSYLATHRPRAVDYIGRAMDFITVRNYQAAISDLDRAIALTPDHAVAYLLRAQARYYAGAAGGSGEHNGRMPAGLHEGLGEVLADYDRAIELSPRSAIAWFDKGNILFETGDYTSALASYSKAIELQPDMGEAYYNRGYVYLKLGNQTAGVSDLSKAGERGIVSSYNLIKRISNTL